ncbi:MAG: hypothetical protein GQ570_11935 [Helicobacteraceae bacterium]|nr:hypothetical protein [Helicobacteraceae bacterium]
MSREIKFRAYNKKTKKMVDAERLKAMSVFALEEKLSIDDFIVLPNSEDYPLMQYTRLKDKNGKEIFEGDIVKGSAYEKEIYTGVVEFYDASFIMKIDGSKGYYRLNKMTFQTLEVIGNLYENKELLND